ncbi:NmrA family NAD(P)-binding protein [Mucilaginibacter gilvus]|uniref:NmrA family NAD(P)-binding protein n=1 Tax=Mucilaginibacter gilvus TaxID=2305909 RepID=UPI001419F405|nr:NmrA family NAD(P)-binding protein [Mucilaginibacter gilvus]
MKKRVIVCGATGKVGGSVIERLLSEKAFRVVALTRSSGSAAAEKLRLGGAEIVEADLADLESLLRAFRDVHAVFAVTQPWDSQTGRYNVAKEIIQAKNILWACRETGISHLIYTSFLNSGQRQTGVSFVDSKIRIEELIMAFKVSYTILRCGPFMDNLQISTERGRIAGKYGNETPVPYTALSDIGRLADVVLHQPASYKNTILNLFNSPVSGRQLALAATELTGKKFIYIAESAVVQYFRYPETLKLRLYFNRNKVSFNRTVNLCPTEVSGKRFVLKSFGAFLSELPPE